MDVTKRPILCYFLSYMVNYMFSNFDAVKKI